MNHYICPPRRTERGVMFTILSGAGERECLISLAALEKVAALKNVDASDADPMDVFHAFEGTINGVAHRIIAANAFSPLVLLQPECFQ